MQSTPDYKKSSSKRVKYSTGKAFRGPYRVDKLKERNLSKQSGKKCYFVLNRSLHSQLTENDRFPWRI